MPLGTLGTGSVEICSDGRFRNLTINNNRTCANRIPFVPHSFLAVAAHGRGGSHVRRLQLPEPGENPGTFLPPDGLRFRAHYPLADCRVHEPRAPVEVVWSAFAPIVPYDYDASALPLLYLGMQITNVSEESMEISALLNWQNTCGYSATAAPAEPVRILRETLVTQGDWDRMKGNAGGDHERRLSSRTGQMESHDSMEARPGDIPPNALVFGDVRTVDSNEDGQYCVTTPWTSNVRTALRIWDPEDPAEAVAFWREFSTPGAFVGDGFGERGVQRCGALCNQFRLDAGQSRSVEFVVAWYCPRYVVNGVGEGNFYANNHQDARAVARIGLTNSKYYLAAIIGWQQRLAASDLPTGFVRRLLESCEVLSTNSIHNRTGGFGLFERADDTRVNYLRDRWFWSMGLLLFYPRLELDILDRLSQRMMDESAHWFRISDGLEGFAGGEFVPPGAAQVEACVHLVIMTWRNFLFGGSLSFLNRMVPRLQGVMAAIIAQDKNFDGFPDLQHEEPGLACAWANGLNVMTAGLWLVALAAAERMARRQKLPEAAVYKQTLDRALRSFERYFWNSALGYYTLYPDPRANLVSETALQTACHVGQLHAPWVARFLGFGEIFPAAHVIRALETVATHNRCAGPLEMISWPGQESGSVEEWRESAEVKAYNEIRYAGCMSQFCPDAPVTDLMTGPVDMKHCDRHVADLTPWYLLVASPAARLDLADKCLIIRPEIGQRGQKKNYTLYTPNGFGAVSIHVNQSGVLQCQIEFRMDIPQELASIHIALPEGLGELQCRLEMEDGPLPVNINSFMTGPDARVEIYPESKLSASAFTLQLLETGVPAGRDANKSQWIPRWLRR